MLFFCIWFKSRHMFRVSYKLRQRILKVTFLVCKCLLPKAFHSRKRVPFSVTVWFTWLINRNPNAMTWTSLARWTVSIERQQLLIHFGPPGGSRTSDHQVLYWLSLDGTFTDSRYRGGIFNTKFYLQCGCITRFCLYNWYYNMLT